MRYSNRAHWHMAPLDASVAQKLGRRVAGKVSQVMEIIMERIQKKELGIYKWYCILQRQPSPALKDASPFITTQFLLLSSFHHNLQGIGEASQD